MNYLVAIRHVLYKLTREYGQPIALYQTIVGDTDVRTGEKVLTKTVYKIRRAAVVPIRFETKAFYSASFLKAARSFAYGGYQDQDMKTVVINGKDLPRGVVISPEDYIVFNNSRYEIKHSEQLEQGTGYQLIVQRLVGAQVGAIHEVTVYQSIRFLNASVLEA